MRREFSDRKKYPLYNDWVDKLMQQSEILNGAEVNRVPSVHMSLFDYKNTSDHLLEIEGGEKGLYMRDGETRMAFLPFVQSKIAACESLWEDYKKDRTNLGFEEPMEMPLSLQEQYYEYKARLTVLNAEATELRKRLAEYKEEDQKEDDSQVLKYGLRCTAKAHGTSSPEYLIGVLKTIDAQKVERTHNGHLIINDDRSPYSGMLVSDYRKFAKQWQAQRQQEKKEQFKKLKERAKAEGLPVPAFPITSMGKVNRANLPAWPTWAKNYLINEKVAK